jgi:hypothetical protein
MPIKSATIAIAVAVILFLFSFLYLLIIFSLSCILFFLCPSIIAHFSSALHPLLFCDLISAKMQKGG